MVEVNGLTIVFDTGPDFRQQMLKAEVDDVHAIVYTHEHKDHVAGMDDVRPLNFRHQKNMPIYCTERVLETLQREFIYVFDERYKYPGIPMIEVNLIRNEPFNIGEVVVTPIEVWHYNLPVFGYRIGDMAYITDANRIEPQEKVKLQGLKVLVLNALRKKKHISHFTLDEAIALGKEVEAEQLYLTHASHLLGKHADVSAELPENVTLAYDGLTVDLR